MVESLPDKRANLTLYPPQSPISKKSFGEKLSGYMRWSQEGRCINLMKIQSTAYTKRPLSMETRVPNLNVHEYTRFRPRIHRNASFHGYNRQTVRSVYQIVRFYGYNSVLFILPCLFLDREAMEIVLPVLTGRAGAFF